MRQRRVDDGLLVLVCHGITARHVGLVPVDLGLTLVVPSDDIEAQEEAEHPPVRRLEEARADFFAGDPHPQVRKRPGRRA